jgi:undecaprenyl-diphosphatase
MSLNEQLFGLLHGSLTRSAGLERVLVLSALYIPFIVAAIVLLAFFGLHDKHRRHWFLLEIWASVFVALFALSDNLQILFAHVRPYAVLHFTPAVSPVAAFSFPSSHASALFALALTVWFYHRREGAAIFLLAFANGIARVAVGVHWPVDIIGGMAVGVIAALVAHAFVRFAEEVHRPLAIHRRVV